MTVEYGNLKCVLRSCQQEKDTLKQERDYWQTRAQDAETIGDFAVELRDRQCLLEDSRVLQIKVEEMRDENEKLREKLRFLRSACPRERSDGEPGFSQDEAYFWKVAAEAKGAEVKKLEDECSKLRAATEPFNATSRTLCYEENRRLQSEAKFLEEEITRLQYQLAESGAKVDDEKRRRVYYQDIVYAVCNSLDEIRKPVLGCDHIVCGTVEEPTTEVQKAMGELQAQLRACSRSLGEALNSGDGSYKP